MEGERQKGEKGKVGIKVMQVQSSEGDAWAPCVKSEDAQWKNGKT